MSERDKETTLSNKVGFYDNKVYYLKCESMYNAVVDYYAQQGISFEATKHKILKLLEHEKAIITEEIKTGRIQRTRTKNMGEKHIRFVWLKKSALAL